MSPRNLVLESSPHLAGGDDTKKVMYTVVVALLPAAAVAVYYFGLRALLLMLVTACSAVAFEALILRLMGKPVKVQALDGSAFVTGLLLAMNLPPAAPLWMALIGSLVAVFFGKQVFGGLGNNPFNPALVARVFLLISFPTIMTTWQLPFDGTTAATPLGILKMEGPAGLERWMADSGFMNLLIGNRSGCIGEVSTLALLLGAVLLMVRRIISWDIPLAFLVAVAVIADLGYLANPGQFAHPMFHLMSGGLILGAFFMATDMVTSPVTTKGRLVFGAGCGILTAVIRLWGGYPEGVSFAILIMNSLVPLIDRAFVPKVFGQEASNG